MAKLKWGKPSLFQKAPAGTAVNADFIYALTEDTALDSGKTYYTKSGETYTAVSSPTQAELGAYYEKKDAWTDLPMPKEGTLQLTQNDGQENTATEEGGEIVDIRYGKATYQVTFDEFDTDAAYAFDDVEGVVADETAIRWLPEDDTKKGVYIPRAKPRVSKSFTVADGSIRTNTLRVLKPEDYSEKDRKFSVREFSKSDMTPTA